MNKDVHDIYDDKNHNTEHASENEGNLLNKQYDTKQLDTVQRRSKKIKYKKKARRKNNNVIKNNGLSSINNRAVPAQDHKSKFLKSGDLLRRI